MRRRGGAARASARRLACRTGGREFQSKGSSQDAPPPSATPVDRGLSLGNGWEEAPIRRSGSGCKYGTFFRAPSFLGILRERQELHTLRTHPSAYFSARETGEQRQRQSTTRC
jgi:hypothetical protein